MLQDFPTRTEQEDRLLQTLNDLGSLQDSEDTDRTDGPGTVKRVVILSSTLGTGHLRAGQAIQAALSEKYSGVEVETFDFWSLMDAGVAQVARQSYLTLVQEYPELYERVFELDAPGLQAVMAGSGELPPLLHRGFKLLASKGLDTTDLRSQGVRFNVDRLLFSTLRWAFPGHVPLNNRSVALMRRILIHCGERVLANRLEKRLRKFKPDIIVATQMLPAALLSTIKRRGSLPVPILGVLVDWGVNEFYLQSSVDHYCVPHASIHGLQTGERFSVTGIPLMPGFRDPPDQQVARTKLGLDAKAAVVLVQGGGLGLHVIDITRALMRTDKLHVLVQAGNNSEANDALQELD